VRSFMKNYMIRRLALEMNDASIFLLNLDDRLLNQIKEQIDDSEEKKEDEEKEEDEILFLNSTLSSIQSSLTPPDLFTHLTSKYHLYIGGVCHWRFQEVGGDWLISEFSGIFLFFCLSFSSSFFSSSVNHLPTLSQHQPHLLLIFF